MTLRQWRTSVAKMSQDQLAALIRANGGTACQQYVDRWERGVRPPDAMSLSILMLLSDNELGPHSFWSQKKFRLEVTADEFRRIVHRENAIDHG